MSLAKLRIHTLTSDTVQQAAAKALADAIQEHEVRAASKDVDWLLLLSGGSAVAVAQTAFELLRNTNTHLPHCIVRLADERWGEPWHSDSNELALKEAGVLDTIARVGARWQGMLPNTRQDPRRHAQNLSKVYAAQRVHATLLLAGMGPDAHTAGILPITDAELTQTLFETTAAVCYYELPSNYTGNPFHQRITITPAFLDRNCQVLLYATGAAKLPGLRTLLNQTDTPTTAALQTNPVLALLKTQCIDVCTDQNLN